MANAKKKENWWEQDDVVKDQVVETAPAASNNWWDNDEVYEERPQLPRPSLDRLKPGREAPHSIRAQLGALKKPEDRLAALRKVYPNAEPYGEDNFIMTDMENGDTIYYNKPGFTLGDVTSVVPEIAEVAGALGGGALGTLTGNPLGVIGGAGAGGTAAKDGTERALNWYFDNEDTRDNTEYAKDKAIDFGLNAGGEALGMAGAKLIGAGYRGAKNQVAKLLTRDGDDAAKVAQTSKDFVEAGITPTVGTVTGSPKQAARENRLVDAYNPKVSKTVKELDEGLKSEFGRITDTINPNPGTRQSVGEAIQDAAKDSQDFLKNRVGDLYKQTDDIVGGASVSGPNTKALAEELKAEKKALTENAKLNKGSYLEDAIKQSSTLAKDLRKGLTFREMQEAREELGRLAFAPDVNPAAANYLRRTHEAVTKDMEEAATRVGGPALDTWKQADEAYKSRFGREGTDRILNPMIKADTGEKAYAQLTANLQHGGTRIAKVREVIEKANGPDVWSGVVRRHIDELGTHTNADGFVEFSGKKFLNNWTKMSSEAKDAMFKGTPHSAARSDLDRLARITDARTRALSAGSGKPDIATDMLLSWNTLGTVSGVKGVSNSMKARLATDPRIVKWFADIPIAQKNGALMDHSNLLRNIGREISKEYGNDWAEQEVNAYLNQFKP